MAYGIKYRFRFWSEHGVLHTVNLLQDGYSGTVTERPLGKAPVIRMQDNGTFRSTSCNLTLECQVDSEFADLYTSDPREFRIDVFRGGTLSAGGELVWQGFVATEIYAEPDIAPPYDVDITATDGLGVLKEYDFEAQGLQKVRDLFKYFLNKTGIDNATINIATTTTPVPVTSAAMFDSTSINMDYMVGENCYDVFDELLRSLHLTVTQFKGNWLLIHETDVENMTTSSDKIQLFYDHDDNRRREEDHRPDGRRGRLAGRLPHPPRGSGEEGGHDRGPLAQDERLPVRQGRRMG